VVTEPPVLDVDEVEAAAVVDGLDGELDEEVECDPPPDVVLDACEVAEPFVVPVEHDARTEPVNATDTRDTSDTKAQTVPMDRERGPLADGGLRS
jgi:hypothetical protein